MQPRTLHSVTFAAALSLLGTSAHAWPRGHVPHPPPAQAAGKSNAVSFSLSNKSGVVQEVEVGGREYTLAVNSEVKITTPEGTQVRAETATSNHHKGDVLFSVQTSLASKTVILR